MQLETVIKVEGLSKKYRLGVYGGQMLGEDLRAFWSRKSKGKSKESVLAVDAEQALDGGIFWAMRNISFEVKKGEILGIIGKNGAGKSTLLKVLSQITGPTEGDIKIKGRLACLLEVGTGMHPELTGRENIFLNGAILGMSRAEIRTKIDEIIDFAGIDHHIDTPVKRYSSGMKVRLGFAVAAHLEPEILVIDEVLAVGDIEFQKKCLGKMKDVAGHGRTVLFVSHNMNAVQSLCTRCILLNKGKIEAEGNPREIVEKYINLDSDLALDGVIRADIPRTGNGEVRFSKAQLIDESGAMIQSSYYRDSLKFLFEYEVKTRLNTLNYILVIASAYGEDVSYSEFMENEGASGQDAGKYSMEVEVMTHLLPGKYTITIWAIDSAGDPYDRIEYIVPFNVLSAARDKDQFYKWSKSHANTFQQSQWTISAKE